MVLPTRPRASKHRSPSPHAPSPAFRQLRSLLQVAALLLLLMYVFNSASILVRWKDMAGKADSKASITAQIEFRAPSLRIESMWSESLSSGHAAAAQWHGAREIHASTVQQQPPQRDEEKRSANSLGATATTYPAAAWKSSEFECLGWVETDDDGDAVGRRECWQRVCGGDAGYCEIRNTTSGDVFRVMHTTPLSLKADVRFTCQLAKAFTEFRHLAAAYSHDPPMAIDGNPTARGIVMTVHERVLPSAYASIRLLRANGCRLPVELWFRHNELSRENPVLQLLVHDFGPATLREIHDERIDGFFVKAHALYYSRFANVLLLDADNFVLRDPTPLFASGAFASHGAVFWPDFWHPGNTIFNVHAQSLLWELLGLEYVDMFEQESGQVLVNRHASRPMLELLMFFATHKPSLLEKLQLVWGDKDLFRLAWLVAKRAFVFVDARMPGSVGVINHERQRFCGMSMAQYDLAGRDVLFLHRNTRKLTGRGDKLIWRVLQEYPIMRGDKHSSDDKDALPVVRSFSGERLFSETSCFGVKRFEFVHGVRTTRVDTIEGLAGVEATVVAFAAHAHTLLNPTATSHRDVAP